MKDWNQTEQKQTGQKQTEQNQAERCRYHKGLADAALGRKKAELVLKGGQVFHVFTGEFLEADVAVEDGIIVGIGSYSGMEEVDVSGKYIVPGFLDAHLHLESTLVNPAELIHQAGMKGTTTFLVDPHEAANVSGRAGIDYILKETEQSQADVYVMLPSCVPAAEFEDNGCRFDAADMREYLENPRILGLGEVMDCRAVLEASPGMMEKLELFSERVMDGHAGYLGEKETDCYRLSGIRTDHECCTFEDALREVRAGLQVLIREGTGAKNLEAIVKGVVEHHLPGHSFGFCTDDKHIDEIQREGHINANVRKAIALGMDPAEAIKIASWYPAVCYGLKHVGAVAPGYDANLVVLSDLRQVQVETVYYHGSRIEERPDVEAGKAAESREAAEFPVPENLLHTVHIRISGPEALRLPISGETARIIQVIPGQILTESIEEAVPKKDGCFCPEGDYLKIAVLERHHGTGKIGLGIIKGFGLKHGAIASTVGHDSHNLIVIGDNDTDMYRAVQELSRCGGGYTVVENGKEPHTLPLEVMGLISRRPYQEVRARLHEMLEQTRRMGVPGTLDPFITMSFLALPVIPKLRITPRGLYDVLAGRFADPV